jgi:hypothetical protein
MPVLAAEWTALIANLVMLAFYALLPFAFIRARRGFWRLWDVTRPALVRRIRQLRHRAASVVAVDTLIVLTGGVVSTVIGIVADRIARSDSVARDFFAATAQIFPSGLPGGARRRAATC